MEEVKYIPGDLVKATKNSNIVWKIEEVIPNEHWKALYRTVEESGNISSRNLYEHQIVPIPLTSEILEKNGWEKSYYGYYIKDNFPLIYNFTETFMVKVDKFEIDSFLKLSFVHQLQHLLFGLGLPMDLKVLRYE